MSEEHIHKFVCPNDGELEEVDVIFKCNTCDSSEIKKVEGRYMCPDCFVQAHPYQCRICDSNDVAVEPPFEEGERYQKESS